METDGNNHLLKVLLITFWECSSSSFESAHHLFWFLIVMYIIRIYINDLEEYECQNGMDTSENIMDTDHFYLWRFKLVQTFTCYWLHVTVMIFFILFHFFQIHKLSGDSVLKDLFVAFWFSPASGPSGSEKVLLSNGYASRSTIMFAENTSCNHVVNFSCDIIVV